LILYSKAICSSLIDFDYETSINYCIKGIQIDYPNFSIEKIKNYNFSNVSYAIINCLCCNYLALNKTSTALKIYLNLVKNIKSFFLELSYPLYRSTEYICKLYQVSLYNISDIYIEQGEYENALLYANIGINFSIDKNIFRFLPDLYFIKFKSNYYLENYIEAKKMYEYTRMLYSISKNPLKAENLEKRLKSEFVKLT
jgi:tetratricopeptide (TPR) repeat protein